MPDDTFVLTSIPFDSPGSINLAAGNVLQITEGGTTYDLHLDPTQNFTGDFFHLASDGGSGTLITEDTTPPPPPPPSLGQSPVVLNDFGWAQGWGGAVNPRLIADVNGDGTSDYVGFGYSSTFIAYGGTFASGGTGPGFTSAIAAVQDFGTSEGYTADVQRGAAAAGVGDGDILYGQGFAGVYWYSAIGATAKTDAAGHAYEVLQYQTSPNLYGNFGSQQGWSSANGFQILKTSTSDTTASILGFGDDGIVVGPQAFAAGANAAGVYVAMGQNPTTHGGEPFGQIYLAMADFGSSQGWLVGTTPRLVGDVTGDGVPDIVGFGDNSTFVAVGARDSSGNLLFTLDP